MRAGRFLRLGLALAAASCLWAQNQVQWQLAVEPKAAAPGATVLSRMTGQIESGWHIYSMSTPGAIPTTIQVSPSAVVERYRVLQPAPHKAFDPALNAETETYDREVTFLLELKLKKDAAAGPAEIGVTARYQTCNDQKCIPPVRRTAIASLNIDPAAPAVSLSIPPRYVEPRAPGSSNATQDQGLGAFLLLAFGFGLATIFTPCVFPMIPITMSYFLNRESGSRRDSITQAVVFCLGIIVLFSGLGLAVTAIVGPVGVSQLGSNVGVNLFITALFIAFGLSLLGAFEITIPSSILTRLNRSSEKGGFAGTLLMGLTFSLASFACVGPFVGTLLAASVGGSMVRPVAGMLTFAAGLALPFFLLALFPSYLKKLPRSGGWMARIKVVMGFVILAASLKYLASVDQVMQWGVLTRDRFLAAWIVLTAMAGLYLLGFVRLEGIKAEERMGLGRLLTGMAFLVLAITFVPGLTGGNLGFWESYVPAAAQSGGGGTQGPGLAWMKNRYREALDQARREGKLVFVNFTGYACANCHWMEGNMFPRPEIAAALKNFVLVELYTDGPDAASEENVKFETSKFGTIATPFYAILDANENVVTTFDRRTTDPQEYLAFLNKGATAAPATPAAPVVAAAKAGDLPQVTKLDGAALDAASLSGKVVVVNFWATWCVPCVGEIPGFNKVSREYGSKGVVVVGVAMDEEGLERVQPFLKKHPMDYTVALGSPAISTQYNLGELPVTVVFDRSGKQLKRFEGFTPAAEIQSAIQQAL
ncbi:MAG TPA: cytochrome c biogenesis protein CcdA [Bryobacteraceae bacterium]|jgi:thiol:disulfide interchange protein DsbD|nr:cytochrome c biogenesis protein CcdA [Bryobacteraceae bacterium]